MCNNEAFGWCWIFLGVVSGLLLGLGFLREEFLGGYASPRRRLLRLGHISFIGLGMLNILFAMSATRIESQQALEIASIALIVSAVAMPAVCCIVSLRTSLHMLFAVPVCSALVGTGVIAWELMK